MHPVWYNIDKKENAVKPDVMLFEYEEEQYEGRDHEPGGFD